VLQYTAILTAAVQQFDTGNSNMGAGPGTVTLPIAGQAEPVGVLEAILEPSTVCNEADAYGSSVLPLSDMLLFRRI
jgi:hypothetical protein